MVPTGKAAKEVTYEVTQLLNAWQKSFKSLKDIAFKAIMVLPSLLLQKPSTKSKTKDHCAALERRLTLWHDGNKLELLKEGATKSVNTRNKIGKTQEKFVNNMQQGNINGAIKLLCRTNSYH